MHHAPSTSNKKTKQFLLRLSAHNHSNEFLVVYVTLRVFLILQQLFDLFVTQLLTQGGQKVPQLGARNVTACILVKVSQALDKVVGCVGAALLRNCLVNGQKDLKRNAFVRFQLMRELLYIGLGWILAKRTEAFANLLLLDLAVATIVEQVEGFLKF